MEPFRTLTSRIILLPHDDIDTDQIIPARYLKVTSKTGLVEGLFSGWRYLKDGSPDPDFPLNNPANQGAQILLAGNNFGCGSSREHAPWALAGWGLRAIISTSFADIFRNNALKNGLLPVRLAPQEHDQVRKRIISDPETQATIDLEAQTIRIGGDLQYSFPIDDFNKTCLLEGIDSLEYLLRQADYIRAYEAARETSV